MYRNLFQISNYSFNPHAIPVMIAGGLIFLIGMFIFFQAQKNIKNISFFCFCLSSSLWLVSMGFVYSANNLDIALLIYKTFTFFGVINLTPNLYLFSAAASGFLMKQRNYIIATYFVTYAIYLSALLTDNFITMSSQYYWGYYPHYEPWNYLFLLTFAIVFFTSQAHLKLAYQREEIPIKKTQIQIIKISLLFGFVAFEDFVAKIWSVNLYPIGFLAMFTLTCFLAYSIVKYKAFDIETVIHKTILWVLSFSIISLPILFVYYWSFPYMKESVVLQLLFGSLSFVMFAMYLRLVQPKIDHFFQRRKTDLEEISSQFSEDLVCLKGVDNLVIRIQRVLSQTLYPQWIDVFICNKKKTLCRLLIGL